MQCGRDVELVEVLVAVACAHVARNGDGTVIIDIGIATYRLVGTVLGHGVVYPHTVFIATGEYSAYACAIQMLNHCALRAGQNSMKLNCAPSFTLWVFIT